MMSTGSSEQLQFNYGNTARMHYDYTNLHNLVKKQTTFSILFGPVLYVAYHILAHIISLNLFLKLHQGCLWSMLINVLVNNYN